MSGTPPIRPSPVFDHYERHALFSSEAAGAFNERFDQMAMFVGRGKQVLDIGGGAGAFALHLAKGGNDLTVMDISPTAVQTCRRNGLKARVCDIERERPRGIGPFDVVVMTEILEHLFDPLIVLKDHVYPLLLKGGRLVVSVPNFAYVKFRLALLAGRVPSFGEFHHGQDGIRPYNLYHKTLFTLESLRQTLEGAGFRVDRIEPSRGHMRAVWSRLGLSRVLTGLRKASPALFASGLTAVATKVERNSV